MLLLPLTMDHQEMSPLDTLPLQILDTQPLQQELLSTRDMELLLPEGELAEGDKAKHFELF